MKEILPLCKIRKTAVNKSQDMTRGSIYRSIVVFAIPLFIGNIFQQLYNMADAMVVGRFVGLQALAAVGASASSYNLIIAIILGIASGASVVIAQIFGSGDRERLRKAYITTCKILLYAGLGLTVIGLFCCGPLLKLLGTPEDVFSDALTYVRYMVIGILATCLYNGMSSFLRSVGNSLTPLIALVISSLVNIGLDVLFVLVFHMGVAGVALATVIAQLISGLYCLFYIHHKMPEMGFSFRDFRMDRTVAKEMIRIALPSTFSTIVVTVSTMFIQAAVNHYGSTVVASYTIGNKVENIGFCLAYSIGLATGVFCGQNIGARNMERTQKGFRSGIVIALAYSVLIGSLMMFLAGPLTALFSSDTQVLQIAVPLIRIEAGFSPVLCVVFVFQNFLRNVSDVRPTVAMSFAEILSRGILPFVLSSWMGYYGIWWATPVGWTLSLVIGLIRYRSGKWKDKAAVG